MYCPQCGTESSKDLKYCRSCGANLKVIGKAVTLSEAIARSDGVPAKIKEIVSNIKIAHVTEEVSRALDRVNREVVRSSSDQRPRKPWWLERKKEKTPGQRREHYLTKGTIKLFWGGGLTIFLYYLAHALVLKLPPDVLARIPFDVDPVVHVLWLLGFIPMLSGLGHIIAGLSIRPERAKQLETAEGSPLRIDQVAPRGQQEAINRNPFQDELTVASPRETPASVTDRTTNILYREPPRTTD